MSERQPAPYELEISVFGPGIGECVVVHVGNGDWIVIDSCQDRATGKPVALEYLTSLGVDVASQLKLVVATHWHDDHIQGLSELFHAAESARFVNSAAYAFNDLLRVVRLGAVASVASSATREFDGVLDILRQRRDSGESRAAVGPIQAIANKKLLSLTEAARPVSAEVFSLSPADGVFNRAKAEIEAALSAVRQGRRPTRQGPNQLCVVLWVRVGLLNTLLGADLEHVSGSTEGWRAIISSVERPDGKARVFKIPHHGSKNADCPESWTELITQDDPIAVVTPYSPSMLPKPTDLGRLCLRTKEAYLTSDPSRYPIPRRENAVEKTLREVLVVKRRALAGQMGHVRVRIDARSPSAAASIDLRNGAKRCA